MAGVGGHALPGDRVDVVMTRDVTAPTPAAKDGKDAGVDPAKRYVSDIVLQDVRVLGMDLNADPTSVQAAAAHTATLQVDVLDAEKLALASQAGSLSLALRRTGNAEVTPVHSIGVTDVIGRAPGPRLIEVVHRRPAAAAVHADADPNPFRRRGARRHDLDPSKSPPSGSGRALK